MFRSLLRSTPFRLMAALTATFLGLVCLAGSMALLLVRADLAVRGEQQLRQSFAVIAQSYGERDLTDLTDLVRSSAIANSDLDRIFLLRDAAGRTLAGNVTTAPIPAVAWSTLTAQQLGLAGDQRTYRVLVGQVGDAVLLVGASSAEADAVSSTVLNSLAIAGVLFFMIAVGAGVVIASRGQRRIDGIAQTMAKVGKGELTARISVAGTGDDIDELSVQVNQALDRLVALVEGMRQVSVNIAHDLKTPLNRLSFTLSSAITSTAADQPVLPLLAQAQEEVGQINATFDALLRIAQIEAGARRARFKPVPLGGILEDLFDAYAEVARENGQVLVLKSGNLPSIEGDKDLLTQLFANLIENSIRHCPAGTRIVIEAMPASDRIAVAVSDDGPGIPTAAIDTVFQRLYRLDASRNTPGSGLGLSLVKAIADLHAATITVGDNGPGTRMTVSFSRQATGKVRP